MLDEIGIEKEMFLVDRDGIPLEPKLYGFPHDEMGFLVEIRSFPSDNKVDVLNSLKYKEIYYKERAKKLGLKLKDYHEVYSNKDWVEKILDKYNVFNTIDYTENIYTEHGPSNDINTNSHHYGFQPGASDDCYRLTSGIHVHFSSRNSNGTVANDTKLDREKITKELDEIFKKDIEESGRNKGEIEEKTHGFEYRALPSDIDLEKVLDVSFNIIDSL